MIMYREQGLLHIHTIFALRTAEAGPRVEANCRSCAALPLHTPGPALVPASYCSSFAYSAGPRSNRMLPQRFPLPCDPTPPRPALI